MKKLLSILAAAILAFGNAAMAENLNFEGVVGMNVANINVSDFNSRIGFHVGVRGTYAFQSPDQGLYANAGALLSLKGAKLEDVTFNPYYLEIPIHMGYKYSITDAVGIFGEFGPYFGSGLFGKTEGVDVFSDEVGYKRFDVGLGLRAGFEFAKKASVSIGYDFGLTDIADEANAQNRNFSISLGYKF